MRVESWLHPDRDVLAVRVHRGGLPAGRVGVRVAFPYARGSGPTATR